MQQPRKIAVLTTHRANNYGACLQSYALAATLREAGADAELLDYRFPLMETLYYSILHINKKRYLSPFGYLSMMRKWYYLHIRDRRTQKAFDDFRRGWMSVSAEKYSSYRSLSAAVPKYDLFVAGSDQVWNPDITGNRESFQHAYMLSFVKEREQKASYAASLGVSQADKALRDIWKRYLADFSLLSVREHEGAELLADVLQRQDVAAHCDPVLLRTPEQWAATENPVPGVTPGRYVLAYTVSGGTELEAYARRLGEAHGLEVVCVQPPIVKGVASAARNVKRLSGVGPREFVWLIHHAAELVTTSFHGSAFALLFGVPLHTRMQSTAKGPTLNSRLFSLFRYFGVDLGRGDGVDAALSPDGMLCITSAQLNRDTYLRHMAAGLNYVRQLAGSEQ